MSQLDDLSDIFGEAGESTQDQLNAVQQSTEANAEAIDQLQGTIGDAPAETAGPTEHLSPEDVDDLGQRIIDNPNVHYVLESGGEYPIKTEPRLTDPDQEHRELRIDGHGARLIPSEDVGCFGWFGRKAGGCFDRVALRDMTLVVDPANGIDAGWGRYWIDEEIRNANLSIEGQRDYEKEGVGDKFGYFPNITSPGGTGVHFNVDFPDGDTPGDGQFEHAIGVGVESEHVGTNLFVGCYLENWWDNGFYVKDGTGSNILIGCEAGNCGGSNIRIGETDQVIACRSVWDDERPSDEIQHGTCLDADAGNATAVNGLRIVKESGENDAARIRGEAQSVTYRDLYIENHTSQHALRISGEGKGKLKIDNAHIVENAGTSVRTSSVLVDRSRVSIVDSSVRCGGAQDDRAAVEFSEGVEADVVRSYLSGSAEYAVVVREGTGRAALDGCKLFDGLYLEDGITALNIRGCNFLAAAENFPSGDPDEVVEYFNALGNEGGPSTVRGDGSSAGPVDTPSDPSSGTQTPGVSSSWTEETILSGTPWEQTVYRFDADESGPTGVVLAGQHGVEPGGYRAAEQLLDYRPRQGELVVIPHADPTAISDNVYTGRSDGSSMDMNSRWTHGAVRGQACKALWEVISDADPDLVLDLHTSGGIWGGTPSGVGQTLWPTPGITDIVDETCDHLNNDILPSDYARNMRYRRGNTGHGTPPNNLTRKCANNDIRAATCEPTRAHGTTVEQRTAWNLATARKMLELRGIETSR